MTKQYDKINTLNNELLDKYNVLLAGDRSENRKLLTDLEAVRLDLMNKEDSVNALAKSLGESKLPWPIVKQSLPNCKRRSQRRMPP